MRQSEWIGLVQLVGWGSLTPNGMAHAHRNRRIEELKAKEAAKVNDLLATLGLKPGQKVTIQPRQPGQG